MEDGGYDSEEESMSVEYLQAREAEEAFEPSDIFDGVEGDAEDVSSDEEGGGGGEGEGAGDEEEYDHAPPETPTLDALQAELMDINSEIGEEELNTAAEEVYQRWVVYPSAYEGSIMSAAYRLYGLNRENGDLIPAEELDVSHKEQSSSVLLLYQRFYKIGLVTDDQETLTADRFKRAMEMMYHMCGMVQMDIYSRRCMDPEDRLEADMNVGKWEFRMMDKADNNPFQSLLLHVLEFCRMRNYRKYGGSVYTQVLTEPDADGKVHRTHAWEETMDFTQLVYECTRKESRYEQWLNFTSQRGIVGHVVDYLENCRDPELPLLEPDRHVWSFSNGLYHAGHNVFYRYGDIDNPIPGMLVAAKYLDLEFPVHYLEEGAHFREISTPNLDKIIDHQQIPTELNTFGETPVFDSADEEHEYMRDKLSAKDWLLAFMGRLIYAVNHMDQWQCQLFIKGVAGSGKSTLGTLVTNLYNPEDVGVMSNNIEHKFGLAAFYKKLVYVCFEVKEDFGLDQGEFQSMISGEKMSIPRKFKDAINVLWETPGLLMGNELAKWTDNSGSVSRRLVIMDFVNKVTRSDPRLHEKLMEEMPSIILKINLAYHTAAGAYGGKDIWAVLPDYYQTQKRFLRASTHPLASFFEFGPCQCGEGLEWEYDEFRDVAAEYFRSNGLFLKSWGQDAVRSVFQDYGVTDSGVTMDATGRRIRLLRGVGAG